MSFWRDRRVLVTGGAGFIGSHLVELLVDAGARVSVPVLGAATDAPFLEEVIDRVRITEADLSEEANCRGVMEGQEIVMHLAAAVGGIGHNIAHPATIFRDNTLPFMHVLEAARDAGVERFLTVSSACVYPRFCSIPTQEDEGFKDRPEPTNEGYGWAKRMEEFLSQAYHTEHGMTIAIARPYNAYGPRDNFRPESSHVIPALIRKLIRERQNPLVVWGSGGQSRSFLYVTDLARGLMAVTEQYAEADPLNIGGDEEVTIRELAETIVDIAGLDVEVRFDTTKPEGQPRRACSTTKMKRVLDFRPEVDLRAGLEQTIAWYRDHGDG
jgi:GDP-L-fucose synthase